MVERGQNSRLSLHVRKFLRSQRVTIDDLKSKVSVIIVSQATEEDATKVSSPNEAQQLEVAEVERTII